jgi:hypothetical protein
MPKMTTRPLTEEERVLTQKAIDGKRVLLDDLEFEVAQKTLMIERGVDVNARLTKNRLRATLDDLNTQIKEEQETVQRYKLSLTEGVEVKETK